MHHLCTGLCKLCMAEVVFKSYSRAQNFMVDPRDPIQRLLIGFRKLKFTDYWENSSTMKELGRLVSHFAGVEYNFLWNSSGLWNDTSEIPSRTSRGVMKHFSPTIREGLKKSISYIPIQFVNHYLYGSGYYESLAMSNHQVVVIVLVRSYFSRNEKMS